MIFFFLHHATTCTQLYRNFGTIESQIIACHLVIIVERGRTRRKRRDFFGTIKKRLSRSKTRSRSVGPEGDANHEDPHSRSISADRARDPGSGTFAQPMFKPREIYSLLDSVSRLSPLLPQYIVEIVEA